MPIAINSKKTGELVWNGSPIKEGWYNGRKVYSKRAEGIYITGTVTDTTYVPRVYVNSIYNGTSSPAGGTWVDAELDVDTKTWKINLAPYMPWKGAAYMFYYNLNANPSNKYIETINIPKNFDTGNLTTMNQMFYKCSYLTTLDVRNFDTSNVSNMYGMFYDCSKLTNLDVRNFDTGKVEKMNNMFSGCSKLTNLDVRNFNTGKVNRMNHMFSGCSKLTTVGDISNWDTSSVTTMAYMFYNCSSLTSLPDISNWNVSNVTDMNGMFCNCSSLTSLPDISGWDTSSVENMVSMFDHCSSLTSFPDISNWNVSNVENMRGMFDNCSSLTSFPDISGWDTSSVENMDSMFYLDNTITTIEGLPPIGDGTKSVSTLIMFGRCTSLANIPICGAIHNTVSFSDSPLTLDSAKIVLNALSTPYQGAQTLTLSSTTKGYINADSEALAIVAEKQAMGWTIAL